MEYYAKSKKVQFTSERINEIKKNMKNIEECLKENLTETDVEILNSSITDIAEKTEEKQKTLKEHHKDIVTCAEMFFLEYGEYFTEKEKKLVVEACRIHDLGKVNLVFQAMICPKLAEKFHIDVRKTPQIPHGFLSAVTISLDEFDDLSELFSDKDFGPFITAVYYHHDREDHYNSPAIRKYAEKYFPERKSPNQGTKMVADENNYRSSAPHHAKTSECQRAGHKRRGSRGRSPRRSFLRLSPGRIVK